MSPQALPAGLHTGYLFFYEIAPFPGHSGAILGRVVGRVRALGDLDRPALKHQGLERSGDWVWC